MQAEKPAFRKCRRFSLHVAMLCCCARRRHGFAQGRTQLSSLPLVYLLPFALLIGSVPPPPFELSSRPLTRWPAIYARACFNKRPTTKNRCKRKTSYTT